MAARNTELSGREREIVELAAAGHTDVGIAHKLSIRPPTVGTYWNRIRAKIGPYSRTEIVALTLVRESDRELALLREKYEALLQQVQPANDLAASAAQMRLAPEARIIVKGHGLLRETNPERAGISESGE
ncbi:MAG: response regulator transcription factor [Fimbriimonas sp.]